MSKLPIAVIGSGFLATNLILGLEKSGYPIHVFSRSRPKAEIQKSTFFHEIDLSIDTVPDKYLKQCNKIFFMLSIGTPGHQNTAENFQQEYSVLKSIVTIARSLYIKDFYFISSSAVYGDQYSRPVREEDNLNPQSEYAKYKIKMEEYLLSQKHDDFNPVIFRVSNPYGLYQSKQGLVYRLLDASINNKQLTIDNQGESIRDYIYISDCIDLIIRLMESTNQYSIYNVSTGVGTSSNELIEILSSSGLKVKYEYTLENKSSNQSISILDNSRIIHEIKGHSITTIRDGIRLLIKQ